MVSKMLVAGSEEESSLIHMESVVDMEILLM